MGNLLTVQSHKLSQQQLIEYAKTASQIRATITHQIYELDGNGQRPSTDARSRAERVMATIDACNYPHAHRSVNPVSPTRKRRKMHELSSATRLLIVKMAIGKGEQRQDVADKFNVKLQVV